jgi:type IV pilus assembly protein PilQ
LAFCAGIISFGHVTPASADAILQVRDVRVRETEAGRSEVLVATTGTPTFSARVAEGGHRLLIDLTGAEVVGAPGAITKGTHLVSGVMTQAFRDGDQRVTRVLVQLAHPAAYRLRSEAGALRLTLSPADKTEPLVEPIAAPDSSAEVASGAVRIEDVKFEHAVDADRVRINLSGAARYEASSTATLTTIEFASTTLPSALERTLDVAAYGGLVRSVSTYRRPSDPSKVVVEIERAADSSGLVSRDGNVLVFTATKGKVPSSVSGVSDDGGAARRTRTVARESNITEPKVQQTFAPGELGAMGAVHESLSEPDRADAFLPSMAAQQNGRRFSGRRIDLDLKDADIHNVLRMLSDVGRVNIITSDAVTGTVTIRMRNVPWDQAMETVLQAKGLGMVQQGNMIRVAPLADLNKERELAIARRKSDLQLAPIETRLIPVSYASAAELQDRAKDMLSPRGSLAVDERTNVLIARDVAGNLNQLEELVRSLDTQTPQVLIEARIVEATSRYLRDVGIQWGGDATFSPATGNPTGLAFPSAIGVVGGASDPQTPTAGLSPFQALTPNPNFAVNLPATVGTGQGGAIGLTFGSINNTVNLAVRLSAAESSGMLRIVSSPRVLTLDNREARISQGTLIPFSQVSAQGVQTTFQEAKLQLLVKPHVTAEGSVAMHVKINRDEPDFNQTSARGDPTILKREAETDLLVLDGHTAVIGGIFTRNTGRNLDQIPLLGDIPILGVLFQRRRASDSRSELVIFLTPRIVNRAEALGR